MAKRPESKRARQPAGTDAPAPAEGRAPLPGGLYLVSTPIGNAGDITLRALDVLARAEAVLAEDTRETGRLMALHGIARAGRPLVAYHEHNAARQRPRVAALLEAGRSVACCSDAGTPSSPIPATGWCSSRSRAGIPSPALPGASALLPALQLSGLPTDRFLFAGFLPAKPGQRRTALAELAPVPATLVFYESPHRLAESLADMADTLGPRAAAVSRELTKRFEETVRGPLPDLAARFAGDERPRGEIVVVVAPQEPGARAARARRNAGRGARRGPRGPVREGRRPGCRRPARPAAAGGVRARARPAPGLIAAGTGRALTGPSPIGSSKKEAAGATPRPERS